MGLYTRRIRGHVPRSHVPKLPRFLKGLQLTRISGAYWRWRCEEWPAAAHHGTPGPTRKQLAAYIHRMEEEPKARSPQVGKRLACSPHPGKRPPGMVVSGHPNALAIIRCLSSTCATFQRVSGYKIKDPEVSIRVSGSAQATGSTTRRTCSPRVESATTPFQADELPVATCRCSIRA